MAPKPYGMICPVTRACEILEPRWTIAVLVALWAGRSRFNEIRREVGSISPALLSKRLAELEALGLVERIEDRATGSVDYLRTEAAAALDAALTELAKWSQAHIDAEMALCTGAVSNLMLKFPKHIQAELLPRRRVVLQLRFSDPDLDYDTYWAVCQPGAPVEVCTSIPGFDVDLYMETDVVALSAIFLNRTTPTREIDLGRLFVSGDAVLARTIGDWLIGTEFAKVDRPRQLPEVLSAASA